MRKHKIKTLDNSHKLHPTLSTVTYIGRVNEHIQRFDLQNKKFYAGHKSLQVTLVCHGSQSAAI